MVGNLQKANAAAFVLNTFIVQTSMLGWYGGTNSDISRKYQTFVTPAGWAFSIWGLIYLSEAANTVFQFFPSERDASNPIVKRIGYWWVSAQLFQVAWTLVFAQELIVLSFICMLGIFISLFKVVAALDGGRAGTLAIGTVALRDRFEVSQLQWWLYYFPFQLHFAWITAATIINTNLLPRFYDASLTFQLGFAIFSLCLPLLSAMNAATYRLDAVHPLVLSWALTALYAQLNNPLNPLPYNAAGSVPTEALGLAAGLEAMTLGLVGLTPLLILAIRRWGRRDHVIEDPRLLTGAAAMGEGGEEGPGLVGATART
mmetsp:Transcript_44816/g.106277  ORF Transcript_44816/g.106277 Transcript_44816/m.106277 type:complete len:315 (+) Transcript_44816:94-1038(+)